MNELALIDTLPSPTPAPTIVVTQQPGGAVFEWIALHRIGPHAFAIEGDLRTKHAEITAWAGSGEFFIRALQQTETLGTSVAFDFPDTVVGFEPPYPKQAEPRPIRLGDLFHCVASISRYTLSGALWVPARHWTDDPDDNPSDALWVNPSNGGEEGK